MDEPVFFSVELPAQVKPDQAEAVALELQTALAELEGIGEPEVTVAEPTLDAATAVEVIKLVGSALAAVPAFVAACRALHKWLQSKPPDEPLTPAQQLLLEMDPDNIIVIIAGREVRFSELSAHGK